MISQIINQIVYEGGGHVDIAFNKDYSKVILVSGSWIATVNGVKKEKPVSIPLKAGYVQVIGDYIKIEVYVDNMGESFLIDSGGSHLYNFSD